MSGKWLQTPPSNNTVRVRMIDTTSIMLLNSKSFVKPVLPGRDKMFMKDAAFLVENDNCGKKAVFDLGVRKDFWNLPPILHQRIDKIAKGLSVQKGVPDILVENGFDLKDINDIIWSHGHWDHTGDPSQFPSSTSLVTGPGLKGHLPGYPDNPSAPQPATSFANRELKEITFDEHGLRIGGFPAHDFYGDGSFYLLETPGHAKGHICGLARVTNSTSTSSSIAKSTTNPSPSSEQSTFVLLGGDVCHFSGSIRPNPTYPLPEKYHGMLRKHPQFPPSTSSGSPAGSDGSDGNVGGNVDFRSNHSGEKDKSKDDYTKSRTPWFKVSTDKSTAYDFPGPEVAQQTFDKLRSQFDEAPNVLLALAHDASLFDLAIPQLGINNNSNKEISQKDGKPNPADLNDWYARGWKEQIMWGWIEDLDSGNPDKNEDYVDGFWKDGVRYVSLEELVVNVS